MASQNNIYPLFFTLERVRNGYILTAKEETGGLKEAEYRKEVVSEDKINARIGQMLQVDWVDSFYEVIRPVGCKQFGKTHLSCRIS